MEDLYTISRHDYFKFEDETTPHIKFIPPSGGQHVIVLKPNTAQV